MQVVWGRAVSIDCDPSEFDPYTPPLLDDGRRLCAHEDHLQGLSAQMPNCWCCYACAGSVCLDPREGGACLDCGVGRPDASDDSGD